MEIFIFARLTFAEAARKRILLAALVLGVLFLIVYGLGMTFIVTEEAASPMGGPTGRNEIYNFLALAGLYVVNFLCAILTVLTAVDTLSGEIQSGVMHSMASKPIQRWKIVLGKWLGYAVLLTIYLAMMCGGVILIVTLIGKYSMPNLFSGLLLIWLNSMVMLSLCLLGGALFSTLANGVMAFGLFGVAFVGGWIEQIGSFIQNEAAVSIGILSSLILPGEALWRRAAYEMRSPLGSIIGMTPFTIGQSVPNEIMVWYAIGYGLVALLLTMFFFGRRDL